MSRLTRKEQKREERKAYKVMSKFGTTFDGASMRKLGDKAYLVDLVLKKLESGYKGDMDSLTPEEKLVYHCLQIAKHILMNNFGDDMKAYGLLTVASTYGLIYPEDQSSDMHMRLVRHGLRHIVEHMEPTVKMSEWMKYRMKKKDKERRNGKVQD